MYTVLDMTIEKVRDERLFIDKMTLRQILLTDFSLKRL